MPAMIFDCDGVLADTEQDGHRVAFNRMFRELGVPLQWGIQEYGEKLKIGGGKERLRSILTPEFLRRAGLPEDPVELDAIVAHWHRRKTEIYTTMVVDGALPVRPGIRRIAGDAAEKDWTLAVASTSAEPSVRAVLEHAVGPALAERFAVFAGDIVPAKKPAPDIYLLALTELGTDPDLTVVVEDSANGLQAARGAGLRTLVTVSGYTVDEDFTGAALVVSSLGDPEPGEPSVAISDPMGIDPGRFVTLADVEQIMTGGGKATGSRQERTK